MNPIRSREFGLRPGSARALNAAGVAIAAAVTAAALFTKVRREKFELSINLALLLVRFAGQGLPCRRSFFKFDRGQTSANERSIMQRQAVARNSTRLRLLAVTRCGKDNGD
ncbi:MAG: hypothetical protein WD738_05760 [Pirellulales bacterium]